MKLMTLKHPQGSTSTQVLLELREVPERVVRKNQTAEVGVIRLLGLEESGTTLRNSQVTEKGFSYRGSKELISEQFGISPRRFVL